MVDVISDLLLANPAEGSGLKSNRSPPGSVQRAVGARRFLLISAGSPRCVFRGEVYGARFPAPPLGLITVAALLPPAWQCRLVNRNTEELQESDLDWADLVMTGGMLPQQPDTLRVIELAHERGKPVAVGGPDATSSPEAYKASDFRVLGEAESIIGAFIEAWEAGTRQGVFEAEKFTTDITQTPIPRFDLLKRSQYTYFGVQFARGCPFNCEFCDIIELYGRMPRVKTAAQMLAELEALYVSGYRGHLDFVDDNFIGNKKAVKAFLPHLIAWQKNRGYPFEFSTEASINIADDDALLALMRAANFFTIFVGIESPDTDTLVSMQKKQNTRRSLVDCVHKIYRAGMFVNAGFIVGFDSEKGSVADAMIDCIEAAAIPFCMVGLLYALPNTQLTRRLAREGRLFAAADATRLAGEDDAGDNVRPGSISRPPGSGAISYWIIGRSWRRFIARPPITSACEPSRACSTGPPWTGAPARTPRSRASSRSRGGISPCCGDSSGASSCGSRRRYGRSAEFSSNVSGRTRERSTTSESSPHSSCISGRSRGLS